jgi:hypothetical protein
MYPASSTHSNLFELPPAMPELQAEHRLMLYRSHRNENNDEQDCRRIHPDESATGNLAEGENELNGTF